MLKAKELTDKCHTKVGQHVENARSEMKSPHICNTMSNHHVLRTCAAAQMMLLKIEDSCMKTRHQNPLLWKYMISEINISISQKQYFPSYVVAFLLLMCQVWA